MMTRQSSPVSRWWRLRQGEPGAGEPGTGEPGTVIEELSTSWSSSGQAWKREVVGELDQQLDSTW